MPTFEQTQRFRRDWKRLTSQQQARFREAIEKFVADLRAGSLRSGTRVKPIEGVPGVFEMTWAPDGRATFEYGPEVKRGHRHIVWRRIGTHQILSAP